MAKVFGFNTTSDEVMEAFGVHAKGKHAIITGSNVGLGLETARSLAKFGAVVTIACRSKSLGLKKLLQSSKQRLQRQRCHFCSLTWARSLLFAALPVPTKRLVTRCTC